VGWEKNGISREGQGAWALRSHRLAAAGTEDGRLTTDGASAVVLMNGERAPRKGSSRWDGFGAGCGARPTPPKDFARAELGRSEAVGHPDEEVINVMGGSIAIGYPFGVTGGRLTITILNEMARRDVQFGLVTVCAAGRYGFRHSGRATLNGTRFAACSRDRPTTGQAALSMASGPTSTMRNSAYSTSYEPACAVAS
jgi:hypothetical protein